MIDAERAERFGGDWAPLLQRAGALRGLGDVSGHAFHGNQWTDVGITSISADHVDALQEYAAGTELNIILRDKGKLSAYDEAHVKKLDEAIAAQPAIPDNIALYRIVDSEVGDALESQDAFVDRGFISTTKSMKGIEDIAADIGVQPGEMTVVRIKTAGGVKGLDVNAHLPSDRNYFRHQREVVLERGLNFVVHGTTKIGRWKVLDVRTSR